MSDATIYTCEVEVRSGMENVILEAMRQRLKGLAGRNHRRLQKPPSGGQPHAWTRKMLKAVIVKKRLTGARRHEEGCGLTP